MRVLPESPFLRRRTPDLLGENRMKSLARWSLCLLLAGGLSSAALGAVEDNPAAAIAWKTNVREGLKQAAATHKPVLLYFHSPDHAACRRCESQSLADAQVQTLLQEHAIPIKVNVRDVPATARFYQAVDESLLPRIVILAEDEKVLARFTAETSPEALYAQLQPLLNPQAAVAAQASTAQKNASLVYPMTAATGSPANTSSPDAAKQLVVNQDRVVSSENPVRSELVTTQYTVPVNAAPTATVPYSPLQTYSPLPRPTPANAVANNAATQPVALNSAPAFQTAAVPPASSGSSATPHVSPGGSVALPKSGSLLPAGNGPLNRVASEPFTFGAPVSGAMPSPQVTPAAAVAAAAPVAPVVSAYQGLDGPLPQPLVGYQAPPSAAIGAAAASAANAMLPAPQATAALSAAPQWSPPVVAVSPAPTFAATYTPPAPVAPATAPAARPPQEKIGLPAYSTEKYETYLGAPVNLPNKAPATTSAVTGAQPTSTTTQQLSSPAAPQQPTTQQPVSQNAVALSAPAANKPLQLPTLAVGPAPSNPPKNSAAAAANPQHLALDGFCPVTLLDEKVPDKKWKKGDVKFGAVHLSRTYLFAGQAEQQKFLSDPNKYCPVISGHDPIYLFVQGQYVQGRREHGIFCNDRLYLFANAESMKHFIDNRQHYLNAVYQAENPGSGGILR